MGSCCDSDGCAKVFGARRARRAARRYRKQGLDPTARQMIDLLPAEDVRGAGVLEIGGGIGQLHVELLRRGAASAVNLELSAAYDEEARRLLARSGLTSRVQRRLADIATSPGAVEPADVVVLHRVVCCYPDHAALLGAAADRTRHHLLVSHPPDTRLTRALFAAENLVRRIRRQDFQVFVHPAEAMAAVLAGHGLAVGPEVRSKGWRIRLATRPAG